MTSYDFIKLLRSAISSQQLVAFMSIYQASEAIYTTFDRVTLLYEGRQIYFGPVDSASDYFLRMGFQRPSRATTADFLTSLTNPAERIVRKGFEGRVPRSPDEFAKTWQESKEAQALFAEIETFRSSELNQNQSKIHKKYETRFARQEQNQFPTSTYPTSISLQILFCIRRGLLRLRNNYIPVVAGIFANTIIALVVGSVFFDLGQSTASMDKRAVLLFFSLMITAFAPAFEIITMWAQRPIVEKHDRYAFYHPFTESLASVICDLPNKVATSLLFHTTLYFMTNLRRTASAFFTYYAFNIVVLLAMSMLFRMIGSLSKTLEQTMAPVSIMVVIFIAYTGFVIPVDYMVGWLRWLRWLNPLAYAYESLMVNEFQDRLFTCSSFIPAGPAYESNGLQGRTCTATGASEGEQNVQGTSYLAIKYRFTPNHLWRNFAVICAMMAIFCTVYLLAAEYVPTERSKGEILVFKNRSSRNYRDEKNESRVDAPLPIHTGYEQCSPALHWNNLNYDIKVKGEKRRILHSTNGWVKPGTLTVLMGVTGAGKTSLLDLLAQRPTPGTRSGHVYIGDKLCDSKFQRKLGYVQQEDIHLPTATVREALMFSALLRQPEEKSAVEVGEYVNSIIHTLEMEAYAEAVVGVPGEGLNLEQRKRLTIAVEMVTNPEFFLFLDEPTSGLDSQTAWSICTLLRKLTKNGQGILCTAHQPSSQIFQMFDQLLLLSSRGETIYFGDIGQGATTIISYLESKGAPKCEVDSNPAEWMLQVTKPPSDAAGPRSVPYTWPQKWRTSLQNQDVIHQLEELKKSSPQTNTTMLSVRQTEYATSLARQNLIVSKRIFRNYWRDPTYLYSKMALCVGVSLANGLSFKSTLDIQGLTNSLFSIFLLTQLFSTIDQQVIPRLTATRELFESRERPSKAYSWVAFLISTILVEIAYQTLASVLVFVCWYYPTGLWRNSDAGFTASERGALVFVLIWLFGLWITTFSQAVAVGIKHAETAVQIATLFFWLSLVFCGVIVSPSSLPTFWVFVYRASPLTYFVNGLVVASLAGTHITCSAAELQRAIFAYIALSRTRTLYCVHWEWR
ncbi:ABC-2 type transporter [Hirsutella rhossiliensis]|uniref:ABC-2 type transporter domain-containing protein n=1 Tax=Hirsutella rhossiliensis TaxID=111463 RepID=A0A9P8N6N9_9HYPO|nr:ABC-2 type transporter domain-containing protein [Hirsutella rhossiliensis]KAH0966779.1 ABC-2 type transporter domain-containing protein [Hirsutella rhossiliensis]